MKVRALGKQLTFYDDDGNVIGHDPPIPEEDPDDVRILNIVDFEDRLMGIDPDADPDFFIDLKELEKFADENETKEPGIPIGPTSIDFLVYAMLAIALGLLFGQFGFIAMDNFIESYFAKM